MNFGPEWDHGPRLVVRRVFQLLVGPKPSIHGHYNKGFWQFGMMPFIDWDHPGYHFNKCGVDFFFGPYTGCVHWKDNDPPKPDADADHI